MPVFEALCLLFDRPARQVGGSKRERGGNAQSKFKRMRGLYVTDPLDVHIHNFLHIRWLDCQQLMLSQHFFESLKFFDKDGVPKSKLRKLKKLLNDQKETSLEILADVRLQYTNFIYWGITCLPSPKYSIMHIDKFYIIMLLQN